MKMVIEVLLFVLGVSAAAADHSTIDAAVIKGNELLEQEAYSDAAKFLDEAIESRLAAQDSDSLEILRLLLPAAVAHSGLEQDRRVDGYFDTAIELLEQSSLENEADLVVQAFETRQRTGSSWDSKKKSRQLVAIYDIASEALHEMDFRIAGMATELGSSFAYQGQREQAAAYLDQAYSILKSTSFVDPDDIGSELLSLAVAYILVDRGETTNELVAIASAIGASTKEPIPLQRAAPVYPSECLRKGISGEVSMLVAVDDTGRVNDVKVTDVTSWRGKKRRDANNKSCSRALEKAARQAVSQFRYIPRLKQGSMIASDDVTATISFDVD